MTIYQKMKKEVDGFVENYKTDFTVHDKKGLKNCKGKFLWMVRPWGTHFYHLWALDEEPTRKNIEFAITWLGAIHQNSGERKYFLGDSETGELEKKSFEYFLQLFKDMEINCECPHEWR